MLRIESTCIYPTATEFEEAMHTLQGCAYVAC
jgi:hypothetical protein